MKEIISVSFLFNSLWTPKYKGFILGGARNLSQFSFPELYFQRRVQLEKNANPCPFKIVFGRKWMSILP